MTGARGGMHTAGEQLCQWTCLIILAHLPLAAQRVAILAQKAHIERQELQLRLQRLKRDRSTAAAAPAAAALASEAAAPAAAAGSSAAAGQEVQQPAGNAAESLFAAAKGRLDRAEQAE